MLHGAPTQSHRLVSQFPTPPHTPVRNVLYQQQVSCTPNPISPLHLRISSHREGIEIMHIEKGKDDGNLSQMSPLHCGSISPNPYYNPALDPINLPFVPPLEITIRVKEPIPDWLRIDYSPLCRQPSSSIPAPNVDRRQPAPLRLTKQSSCQSRLETTNARLLGGKVRHRHSIEKASTTSTCASEDCSSYFTSSTADHLSEGSTESLIRPKRKSFVRREINHMLGKVHLSFRRTKGKDHDGLPVGMQRSSGCLT